jgi:peptide deformylase
MEGEELLSRAFQHEIDHLDGVLFIDRLSPLKRDLVKRRIRKLQKNGEW